MSDSSTDLDPPSIAIYFRVSPRMRARIEAGRLAGHENDPWRAPSLQTYLTSLIEPQLPVPPKGERTLYEAELQAEAPRGRVRHAGGARKKLGKSKAQADKR